MESTAPFGTGWLRVDHDLSPERLAQTMIVVGLGVAAGLAVAIAVASSFGNGYFSLVMGLGVLVIFRAVLVAVTRSATAHTE
ncbi:MAG: hypothetical protein GY925_16990 [Actinomycetia bacterium]|nr:hypothetical protein [Actinomycetes bacterium]